MKGGSILKATSSIVVRFSDCDPLCIVWHGNYLKYFEDGREAFSKAYDFDYYSFYRAGYSTPLIHSEMHYKRPLRYRDIATIETTYQHTEAAKIIFHYVIKNQATSEIICTGSTTQVFVTNLSMELMLVTPDFIHDWMKKVENK